MTIEYIVPLGIVFALFLAVLGGLLRKSQRSGSRGEAVVARRLFALPPDEYRVINDVMLPAKDGTTTQVDHVVVSSFGIFVVETKDYSGWIFGSENQQQWTQSLHAGWGGTEKHHFQNPIRQNWRHIFTLSDLLELPSRYFHNVVAFCGDAEFKTVMPDNVMYSRRLVPYIRSFDMPVMSAEHVDKTVLAIRAFEATLTEERREQHVANLKSRHDPVQLAVAAAKGMLKCPKCGAPMVLRHRRSDNAPFYGCSKYPSCRGIMSAN